MSTHSTRVDIADHGGVGVRTLTLNRPERLNAIDMAMILDLEAALVAALEDPAVGAILLRGAGPSFCAGDDVTAQADICAGGEGALRRQLVPLQHISELLTLGDKPTVAAVRGWAVGAGFSWVLNCDFALWSEGAGGFFPEVSFGTFVTGGATWLLPQIAGRQVAHELLLLGRRVRAPEALTCGLALHVEPEEALDAAAINLAQSLAALPRMSVRHMKRVLDARRAGDFRAALAAEMDACLATTLDPETIRRMQDALPGTRGETSGKTSGTTSEKTNEKTSGER
jgi:enoyl-CoA hydratase/carnithine racemase